MGTFPCLVAGSGSPLLLLAGLAPEPGVAAGPLRRMHEAAMRPWAPEREVFYVNRRPGLPRGISMAALAAEHAQALRETFDEPVDLLGASTGGSAVAPDSRLPQPSQELRAIDRPPGQCAP